jgi:hypothetical protein
MRSPKGPKISGRKRQMSVRTDCFNREFNAEGQKQIGRITQMAIKGKWPLEQI